MKRFHVHAKVADVPAAIDFYTALFAVPPSVMKPDYAKWMLDDPRVNFAVSLGSADRTGVEHLGIQSENAAELADTYARLATAGRPVLEEGRTTCCYARSEKSWIADPDGLPWEAFLTDGEATTYGDPGPQALLAPASAPTSASCGCCPA